MAKLLGKYWALSLQFSTSPAMKSLIYLLWGAPRSRCSCDPLVASCRAQHTGLHLGVHG